MNMLRFDYSLTMMLGLAFLFLSFGSLSLSSPLDLIRPQTLEKRITPYFPDQPPSCPICAQNYNSINSCAQACTVFENFSMIIFNPGAFIDVIECACTDTFQSAFPQCVDCFEQTNQTGWLSTPDLPGVVNGMRQICAIASTLLGNVSEVDGESTPTSAAPTPTASTSSGVARLVLSAPIQAMATFAFLSVGISLIGL